MFEKIIYSIDVTTILFVAISCIILGYRPPWWWHRKLTTTCTKGADLIPGPISLPLFGTSWFFSVSGYPFSQLHCYYGYLYKKFGPIVKEETLFNVPIINLFEKNEIEIVLRHSGRYPLRPPTEAVAHYRKSRPDKYATTGLVNEQGETWCTLRSALTPALTSPKTIQSFLPQVEEIADDWCNLIKHQRNKYGIISNVEEILGRLSIEITCALVLGRRMGFLLPEEENINTRKLEEAVHQHFLALRDTYFGFPYWKIFSTSAYRKLVRSEEAIYELALELVKTANEFDSTKDSPVFQSIVTADIDPRERTAGIVDFIAAGIHTVKNSFQFLLHLVGRDPHVQENILNDPTGSYLKACVTESFRFCPTAYSLARILDAKIELKGYQLNPGTVIVCHNGLACRDEKNFKRADEFRPERWLGEERAESLINSTFLLSPFGSGRRICPGKRLIEHTLPIFLEYTVKNFCIKAPEQLDTQFEFLVTTKGLVSMEFTDRL